MFPKSYNVLYRYIRFNVAIVSCSVSALVCENNASRGLAWAIYCSNIWSPNGLWLCSTGYNDRTWTLYASNFRYGHQLETVYAIGVPWFSAYFSFRSDLMIYTAIQACSSCFIARFLDPFVPPGFRCSRTFDGFSWLFRGGLGNGKRLRSTHKLSIFYFMFAQVIVIRCDWI